VQRSRIPDLKQIQQLSCTGVLYIYCILYIVPIKKVILKELLRRKDNHMQIIILDILRQMLSRHFSTLCVNGEYNGVKCYLVHADADDNRPPLTIRLLN
jgi:hypothetical protein